MSAGDWTPQNPHVLMPHLMPNPQEGTVVALRNTLEGLLRRTAWDGYNISCECAKNPGEDCIYCKSRQVLAEAYGVSGFGFMPDEAVQS